MAAGRERSGDHVEEGDEHDKIMRGQCGQWRAPYIVDAMFGEHLECCRPKRCD